MTATMGSHALINKTEELGTVPMETRVVTAKGKGKLKTRRSQPSTALVHAYERASNAEDFKNDERRTYPSHRFAACFKDSWVRAVQLRLAGGFQEAHQLLQAGTPLKMTGSNLACTAPSAWTMQHLVSLMSQTPQHWVILCSDCKRNAFMNCNNSKNIFGSYYHIREPETQQLQMHFGEYAECADKWTAKTVLFDHTIMQQHPGQPTKPEPDAVPGIPSEMTQHLQSTINWAWLEETQQLAKLGRVHSVSLQSASYNGLLPAQYKTHDRLIAQVHGAQRMLLISPEYAFKGMYPYPMHHPNDAYSMANLEEPDVQQWPGITDVKGQCCILQPQDVVFVPAYWFVHTQFLESSNISLTFHMSGGRRARAPECIPLQLSRHLEWRVANVEGVADVRHWLQLLGFWQEDEWIDLATVQGYRRQVMCQEVLDEVQLQLDSMASHTEHNNDQSEEQLREFLLAMCNRRLLPTDWLNKDFREQLYLTDIPKQYEDTRTAEERKYPELFRHRQHGGWVERQPKLLTNKSTNAATADTTKAICPKTCSLQQLT